MGYLNDVAEGGETIFLNYDDPLCEDHPCPDGKVVEMESCEEGLKVEPREGTVILWYNFHPNGRRDPNSLHAACPVGANLTKWSANKWVKIKPDRSQASWMDDHPALER